MLQCNTSAVLALMPAAAKIAFTGGVDFNDHVTIWDRLDRSEIELKSQWSQDEAIAFECAGEAINHLMAIFPLACAIRRVSSGME